MSVMLLKKLIPASVKQKIKENLLSAKENKAGLRFLDRYTSWEEASLKSSGYHAPNILSKVVESARLVTKGEAAFERDGVLFQEYIHNFPLVSILESIFLRDGYLKVVDFGGSLGSSFMQLKPWFQLNKMEVKWAVVEQEHFVEAGKEFETENLSFHTSMHQACEKIQPNLALCSSVIQYIPDKSIVFEALKDFGIQHFIVDRTTVCNEPEDIISVQTVGEDSETSYPIRIFSKTRLSKELKNIGYQEKMDWQSYCDPLIYNSREGNYSIFWKGYYFSK